MQSSDVVLIVADDWSPLAGCYGNPVVRTPHIDRLAARGTRFRRAYCTAPTCAASRANLLTGLYGHQHRQYGHCHGAHHFRTDEKILTLPAVLRRAGFASALVGKSHVAPTGVYPFAHWCEPDKPARALFSNHTLVGWVEECIKATTGRPSFLLAASGYPHRTGGGFEAGVHEQEFAGTEQAYDPAAVLVPDFLPDTAEVRADLAGYYRFVSRFDAFVGGVLEELERADRLRSTLVILLSDHGMPFPGAKASPFEAGHHCPLIIAPPDGQGAGQVCDALVNWSDIMPTILEGMGVTPAMWPAGLPGRSLLPLLRNPAAEWRDVVFDSHAFHEVTNYFPYRSVRGRRFKYVRCLASGLEMPLGTDLFDSPSYVSIRRTGGATGRCHERLRRHWPEALFDLDSDPLENVNLIDRPELVEVVNDYRERLLTWRIETGDPWLEVDYQEGRIANRIGPA